MTAGVKPAEDQFTDLVNQYHQQRGHQAAALAGDIDAEEVDQQVRIALL